MSFGMEISSAAAKTIYSSDDVTWNQVDMLFCPGGGSAAQSYSVLAGKEVLTVQMMINPPPLTHAAIAHTIAVNGTTVSAGGGSEDTYILVLMR